MHARMHGRIEVEASGPQCELTAGMCWPRWSAVLSRHAPTLHPKRLLAGRASKHLSLARRVSERVSLAPSRCVSSRATVPSRAGI